MRASLTDDERIMLDTADQGLARVLISLRKSVEAKAGALFSS